MGTLRNVPDVNRERGKSLYSLSLRGFWGDGSNHHPGMFRSIPKHPEASRGFCNERQGDWRKGRRMMANSTQRSASRGSRWRRRSRPTRSPVDLVPADGPAGNPSITLELEGVGPVCTAVLNGKSYRRMLKALAEAAPRGSRSCSRGRSGPARVGCRSSRARASRPCPGPRRRRPRRLIGPCGRIIARPARSHPRSRPGTPRSPATGPGAAGTRIPPRRRGGPPRAAEGPGAGGPARPRGATRPAWPPRTGPGAA